MGTLLGLFPPRPFRGVLAFLMSVGSPGVTFGGGREGCGEAVKGEVPNMILKNFEKQTNNNK